MKRTRIIGLALVAVFVMGAVAAASASAAEYIYKVEGVKLGAGETEAITKAKAATPFVLTGEAFGVKAVTTCTKLKLDAAESPIITGGQPGTSSKEKIEFSGCTATVGGEPCSKVKVENTPSTNELVTVVLPAAKAGDVATRFNPVGSVFTTIKFTSCGIFGSLEARVEGDTAALDSVGEAKIGTLLFASGAGAITKVKTFAGVEEEVELVFAGSTATLAGEAELQLTGVKKWGVA